MRTGQRLFNYVSMQEEQLALESMDSALRDELTSRIMKPESPLTG